MKTLVQRLSIILFVLIMTLSFVHIDTFASGGYETKAPRILGVTPVTSSVQRPGVMAFDVEILGEDVSVTSVSLTVSHIDYANENAYKANTFEIGTWEGNGQYSGTVRVEVPISANDLTGTWRVYGMSITDSVGNHVIYSSHGWDYAPDAGYAWFRLEDGTEYDAPVCEVTDEFDYYRRVSLSHPDLIEIINGMPEGKALSINIDKQSQGILPKDAFDAIRGLDKTLVVYNDSYQWIINGTEVTKDAKDVNVLTSISTVSESEYDTSEDAIAVNFHPNGELPSPVEVRFKSDYLYDLEGITGVLHLYYINNGTPEEQHDPNFDLVFDGTDKWCYFTITHNSQYVISGSKVNSKKHTKVLTEQWVKDSRGWYWVGANGKAVKSKWIKDKGSWYYLKANGYMATNEWVKDSKGWCYLGADGKMVANGWAKDSKGWVWMNGSGYWDTRTGWIKYDGGWYHTTNGYRDQNKWKKDSKGWCYLGSNGRMVTNGWAKDSVGWCWMGSNGYWVANKWVKDKGEWYYIKSNHYMAANEWAKDSGGWMYMAGNGKITKSKWIKSGGYWYYLKDNGYMATGTMKIGSKTYKFDGSGRWVQ